MTALRLWELASSYDTLRALADMPDAEPGEWEQALADLQEEGAAKVTNIGLVIQELRQEQAIITDEINRLKARAESRIKGIGRLNHYLVTHMPALGLTKVNAPRITVYLQANPPSVAITDPEAVPVAFRHGTLPLDYEEWPDELREKVQTWGYDKRAILDVLKGGLAVPGARIEQGQHVRVR